MNELKTAQASELAKMIAQELSPILREMLQEVVASMKPEKYLTADEAAELFGVSEITIRRAGWKNKDLEHVFSKRGKRYLESELQTVVRSKKHTNRQDSLREKGGDA